MKRIITATAIAVVSGACFVAPAYAANTSGMSSSAQVLSGGVGENARQQLAQQASGHELKLVFASTPSGAYLADIPVTITDQAGRTVVEHVSEGPWMFVDFPSGTYTIKATVGDTTHTRRVSIKEGGHKTVHFRWPEIIDQIVVHTAGR